MTKRKMGWWWPTLAAIGLVVAVITGVQSSNRMERASRMPQETDRGSEALEGAKTEVHVLSDKERAREAERIRAAREAEEKKNSRGA